MKSFKRLNVAVLSLSMMMGVGLGFNSPADELGPPALPEEVKGKAGIKKYLVGATEGCVTAAHQLQVDAYAYKGLIDSYKGDYAKAASEKPELMARLIKALRDDYQRLDSYGYEYIEGIIAGVPSLAKYDIELDAGVPAEGADNPDDIAPVKIVSKELSVDREGAVNNALLEPTVFGSNPKFTAATVNLPELGKVGLPKASWLVALADYAVDGYSRMDKSAKAWSPTDSDMFSAMVAMTPTLADYFEEWKDVKLGKAGGSFVAVSRVSDMKGIMGSTHLIWLGVRDQVILKDADLAASIDRGYDSVLDFVEAVKAREGERALTVQEVDALGSRSAEKVNKLTEQVRQSAVVLSIKVEE